MARNVDVGARNVSAEAILNAIGSGWQSPVFMKTEDESVWMAMWPDNTDSADPVVRIKWGTNREPSPAAGTCCPASINDETSLILQQAQRNAGLPPS